MVNGRLMEFTSDRMYLSMRFGEATIRGSAAFSSLLRMLEAIGSSTSEVAFWKVRRTGRIELLFTESDKGERWLDLEMDKDKSDVNCFGTILWDYRDFEFLELYVFFTWIVRKVEHWDGMDAALASGSRISNLFKELYDWLDLKNHLQVRSCSCEEGKRIGGWRFRGNAPKLTK